VAMKEVAKPAISSDTIPKKIEQRAEHAKEAETGLLPLPPVKMRGYR
jgi:hypothetical protein